MISKLPDDAPTDRQWNFNDEVGRNYMLYIPVCQTVVTAILNWKKNSGSKVFPVGRYRFDLRALEAGGYVRFKDNRYFLRFQRTNVRIEIAINRTGEALVIGQIPMPGSDS